MTKFASFSVRLTKIASYCPDLAFGQFDVSDGPNRAYRRGNVIFWEGNTVRVDSASHRTITFWNHKTENAVGEIQVYVQRAWRKKKSLESTKSPNCTNSTVFGCFGFLTGLEGQDHDKD